MINPNAQPIDIAEQQTWLADHKKERGYSWSQLSSKIGVPQSTLSMFPGGGYRGDNAPIAQAVFKYRQLLKSQAEVAIEMREPPSFYMTPTGKRIQTMLTMAQRGRIVVIAGAPGMSKTKVIENYRQSVSNVWIATMAPSTAGVNTMQQEVLESFGEADAKGTPRALSKKIVSFVKDTNGLIIIDEAQHTSELALEEIRSWYDRTGIVGKGQFLFSNMDLGEHRPAMLRRPIEAGRDSLQSAHSIHLRKSMMSGSAVPSAAQALSWTAFHSSGCASRTSRHVCGSSGRVIRPPDGSRGATTHRADARSTARYSRTPPAYRRFPSSWCRSAGAPAAWRCRR